MTNAAFRYAVPLSGTYVLRVQTDISTANVNVGPFDPTVDYFMLGDGSDVDALQFLADALVTHADVTTASCTVDADGHVVLTYTGSAGSLAMLWSNVATTLDGPTWGWTDEDTVGYPDVDPNTSPAVPMGLLPTIGGRPVSDDSRPRQNVVGGVSRSISGLTRGSRFALPLKDRFLSVDLLLQTYALDEYAPATAPFATFESMFVRATSTGRAFHYIPDVLDPGTYSVLRLAPPMPLDGGLIRSDASVSRLRWSWSAQCIVDSEVSSDAGETPFTNVLSFDFDGSGDAIAIGDRAEFDAATAMTISVWLQSDASAVYKSIVSKFDWNNQCCFELAKLGTTDRVGFYVSSAINQQTHLVTSTSTIPEGGAWLHLVAVFDGSQTGNTNRARMYFDSVLDTPSANTGTIPAALLATSSALRIGLYDASSAGSCFDGCMDEIAIWVGVAANQTQVDELFNGGEPGDLDSVAIGPPTFWYRGDGDTLTTVINHGTAAAADGTATAGVTLSAAVP